jgi:Carboxypeptidase regulatory-like domain/TonB dependent receptor-like, beta-barrel
MQATLRLNRARSVSRSGSPQNLGFICCVAALGIAILAQPVGAQVLYGTIVGNVKDTSQAAVPGATVTIVNPKTNVSRETITNESGAYTVSNVLPGTYTVKVSLTGFKEFSQTDVQVTINNVTRVDATLNVGSLAETVTVAAIATPLQTDKTDVSKEISAKEITDLPLNQYRNYQTLLDLVPGVTPSAFQNAVADTPELALTTNVNGTARNSNNTRLDGATTVLTWLPHHALYISPQESIETVSVSTNNFDAEQGMAGGAAITVQTKTGTNEFHAVVFEYHTNSSLRAKPFFIPPNNDNPKNIVNMYGGTLGGPIVKDKLFFFSSFEGLRQRQNGSAQITVPTAQHKAGDFSDVGARLFDPLTGDIAGAGREEFAGSVIPSNRISPIAAKVMALVPLPNLPGYVDNYYASGPGVLDRDNYDFKVDWVRSPQNTIWAKYSRMNAFTHCEPRLKEAIGDGLCGGIGDAITTVQVATLGATYVFSPTFLVDGTVGFSRYYHTTHGVDYGTNIGSDVLGIPGTNGPDPRQSGFPILAISNYAPIGNTETWSPVLRRDNSWTYTTNANLSKGKHDIRFGFDLARQHMNHWQPELGGRSARGNLRFGGGATTTVGGPGTLRYNSLAQFLLGFTDNMGTALQNYDPMSTREWLIGLYLRDRWQFSRKLTLTLGVRWEYYPLMTRAHSGIERYDLDENKVYLGRFGGVEDNVGVTTSMLNFGPRVGFAYRLTDKSVLRAGYGITVDPYPTARPLRSPYPVVIFSDHIAASRQYSGTLATGIPPIVRPDLSSGIIDIPPTIGTRTIEKGDFKRGYIQSWNFTYEHQLPLSMVGSVGYVGTRSIHQFATIELNTAPAGGGTAGLEFNKKFGRTASTGLHSPWQTSLYDSLQATVDRRFSGGLFMKNAYTWSKAIGYNANSGEGCCTFTHPSVMHRQRAIQDYDRTHMFKSAWIWELPFGANKRWAQEGFGKAVLGGWQVNGIFSAYSGTPFTVTASGTSLNSPVGTTQVADQVLSEVKKLGDVGPGVPFFDPLAFRQVTEVRFGNVGRNSLRGPGFGGVDFGLFRAFRVSEDVEIQFRADASNLTNTPHFNNPVDANRNASNMTFNPDGSLQSTGNFMSITSARPDERQFRFGLRISF